LPLIYLSGRQPLLRNPPSPRTSALTARLAL
jgi:hypothetical protein